MRTLHSLTFSLSQLSGLVLAQNGGKPCSGWNLRLGQDILTYPNPVVASTVTAQVVPYVTEYEDGRQSTTLSTVVHNANGAAAAAFTPPANEPLTWQVSGLTLTYPTTYILFDRVSGGPNVAAPTPAAASCTGALTSVKLPAAVNPSSLLFPVAGPVATAAAVNAVVNYLGAFPDVVAQFSGTNLKDCALAVDPSVQSVQAAGSPATKTSITVLTQTQAPVVIKAVGDTTLPNVGVARPAVPGGAAASVAAVGAVSPSPVPKIGVGLSLVEVSPGVGSAVVLDHSVTLAPGAAGTVNGVPVSLQANGASFVIDGTKSVVNPIFAVATGVPVGIPAGVPAGVPVSAPVGVPTAFAGGVAGGVPGAAAAGGAAGVPFGGPMGMFTGAPFPTGYTPPAFIMAGQNFAPVTALYVAGQYLLPGQALVVANSTLSLPAVTPGASSVIVINNITSTLPNLQRALATNGSDFLTSIEPTATQPLPLVITSPPPLVVNGRTFDPLVTEGKTLYPISPGQTVTPGKKFTLAGTRCSLDPSGTALVVGSSTFAMQSTIAWVHVASVNMTAGAYSLYDSSMGSRSPWMFVPVILSFLAGLLLI